MTDHGTVLHPLHREMSLAMWITRIFVAIVILACGAGIALSLAKADRVACIDDLEVAWRIDVGNGVTHLIEDDQAALPQDAANLSVTTRQLEEVGLGDRCPYRPPWPLNLVAGD